MTNTDDAPTPSRRHGDASARRAMPQGHITIGLVENDPYALALLRPQIERLDPRFSILWVVSTGAKAIHHCLFTSPRPQVLVIDMGLSDMPGTRVCEVLRQHGCTAGVVGITALPTADWAARLAACGGQALIAKDLIRGNLRPAIVASAAGQAYQSEGNGKRPGACRQRGGTCLRPACHRRHCNLSQCARGHRLPRQHRAGYDRIGVGDSYSYGVGSAAGQPVESPTAAGAGRLRRR